VKIGAERNKVLVLAGLLLVAGVLFYQQFFATPDVSPQPGAARSLPPARSLRTPLEDVVESRVAGRPRTTARTSFDFKPSLKRSKPGEGPDPLKMDPTLRTDLVAKARAVSFGGVERNLFQFGAAKPKVTPQELAEAKKQAAAAEAKVSAPNGPPPKPPEPVAPPVNMKYYGYASRPGDARKRAFLLDGDEIFVAAEGEVIKKRYRVVRIGVNSLVVEDLQFRSQQTLPLQEG